MSQAIGSSMGPLQRAVWARLSTDVALAAAGVVIADDVPAGDVPRYIVIGDKTEVPKGFFGQPGRETTIAFDLYSNAPGDEENNDALTLLDVALWPPLVVTGFGSVRLRFEIAETNREDGWRHLQARYRATALAE